MQEIEYSNSKLGMSSYYCNGEWYWDECTRWCSTSDIVVYKLNGDYHRADGPAIEYDTGNYEWYLHGKRHREDGPAFVGDNNVKAWYLDDVQYTEKDFLEQCKK